VADGEQTVKQGRCRGVGRERIEQAEDMLGTSQIASFATGIVAGLIPNMLWDKRYDMYRRFRREPRGSSGVFAFNPIQVGLYPINRWTSSRPLEPSRLRLEITGTRPAQQWCDPVEWRRLADELAIDHGGDIAYLVDFSIDHRESSHGGSFSYTVTACDYAEHLATLSFLRTHSEARDRIKEAFDAGRLAEFARTSPPSLIKMNVAILSPDRRFLAIQRSAAVQTKKGLWTVGPNETMALTTVNLPGRRYEDLFELAERCLREEVGMEPDDYGSVRISWIGYEAATAIVKIFAQVQTKISCAESLERMSGAHSLYEAQDATWLPFANSTLSDIVENWEHGDQSGRRWSSSAPLALQELWRMRRTVRSDKAAP